jgi:hypothetical protein
MADLSSLISAFTGQATAPTPSTTMPWQQALMEQVDPEKARQQNIAQALAKAGAAMASTPGNFLTGLSNAATTGANAYISERPNIDARRAQALLQIQQQQQQDQERQLNRLRDAIGVQSGADNTQYQRGRDAIQEQQWQKSFDAEQEYRNQQLALSKKGRTISDDIAERKAAADGMGLTPQDPAYKAFVLTGKMPREDQAPLTATDKQAILSADDNVLANQTAIDALKSVITPDANGRVLNEVAGSGATAGWQSWAARNDPTGLLSDETGQATTDLQNVVLGQALSSLKSTFGAAPTEGERKILIELQASIDKTPEERKAIINRAIKIAERRLTFNEQRARGLRGGDYYKPQSEGGDAPAPAPDQTGGLQPGFIDGNHRYLGGDPNDQKSWEIIGDMPQQSPSSPATPPPASPGGDPLAQARAAIAQGADPAAVRQRLIDNGIDPSGL